MGKINLNTTRFPYWQKILISLYYGEKNILSVAKDTKCTYNYTYRVVSTLFALGIIEVHINGRESICRLNNDYREFTKDIIKLKEKIEAKQNEIESKV